MAVESKPLFHPEVMRQQVRAFTLPEHVAAWQPKLQQWAELIASGRADEFKETELLPGFLTDIFCGLLGYTGPAEAPDSYTLSRERHVEVDGEFADAVLGRFGKEKAQFITAVEGKGTRDPLDRPFAGRWCAKGGAPTLPAYCWLAPMVYPWRTYLVPISYTPSGSRSTWGVRDRYEIGTRGLHGRHTVAIPSHGYTIEPHRHLAGGWFPGWFCGAPDKTGISMDLLPACL
jgi:hypothetical protein